MNLNVLSVGMVCCWFLAFQPSWAQSVLYQSDFQHSSLAGAMSQAPGPGCVVFASDPAGGGAAVLKVTVDKDADFHGVANGAPRAELNFAHCCTFSPGHTYQIRWSTFLPASYEFDIQPEGMGQIHQGPAQGTPPVSLTLDGNRYRLDIRFGQNTGQHLAAGDAGADRGRWTSWLLTYRPDSSGSGSITRLYKNNQLIANGDHIANAYPQDDGAYFKLGLYKWWWQQRPSNVSKRTLYFGEITISQID